MHYTDAIAQLRALGFTVNKFGAALRFTHRDSRPFHRTYHIEDNGLMPDNFIEWLNKVKPKTLIKIGSVIKSKTSNTSYIITQIRNEEIIAVRVLTIDPKKLADYWEIEP